MVAQGRDGGDSDGLSRGGATGESDDFGFDHDAAVVRPRPGGIARIRVDVFSLPTGLAPRTGLHHRRFGEPRQDFVFGHRDDAVEPRLGVEESKTSGVA